MIGIMKLNREIPSARVIAAKAHNTRKSLPVLNSKKVKALTVERNNPRITLTR